MQPHLQRFKVQTIIRRDDQLAVEDELFFFHAAENVEDFGEIAAQRFARPRNHLDRLTVAPRNAAEAVPLGLILPAVALGQFCRRQRFHRN